MKNRILKNWNFQRFVYLLLGAFILFDAIPGVEWFGIVIGGYIASMGIFAFGCASGNCANANCSLPEKK